MHISGHSSASCQLMSARPGIERFGCIAKLFFIFAVLWSTSVALAQSPAGTATNSFGTLASDTYDTVDLANLYISWRIPVFRKPATGFTYSLVGYPNLRPMLTGEVDGLIGMLNPSAYGGHYPVELA
jgi:hypothetical protein